MMSGITLVNQLKVESVLGISGTVATQDNFELVFARVVVHPLLNSDQYSCPFQQNRQP